VAVTVDNACCNEQAFTWHRCWWCTWVAECDSSDGWKHGVVITPPVTWWQVTWNRRLGQVCADLVVNRRLTFSSSELLLTWRRSVDGDDGRMRLVTGRSADVASCSAQCDVDAVLNKPDSGSRQVVTLEQSSFVATQYTTQRTQLTSMYLIECSYKKVVLSQRWPRDACYISRSWVVVEIWPFEIIQDGGSRHLEFIPIENSAIRSAVPENPTL